MRQAGLGGAVGHEAAAGGAAHHRRDADDRAAAGLEHRRHRGPGEGVGGGDVPGELADQPAGRRVEERAGHGAADVVHDDVDAPELLGGDVGEAGDRVEVAQVGRHDDRLPAERLDLLGHRVELLLRARREHDVGARLGQRQRRGGADAAPRAGHDRHLVVDAEPVLDHPAKLLTGTPDPDDMRHIPGQSPIDGEP